MKTRFIRYTLAFAFPAALVAACSPSDDDIPGGTGGQTPTGGASAGSGVTGGMTGQSGGGGAAPIAGSGTAGSGNNAAGSTSVAGSAGTGGSGGGAAGSGGAPEGGSGGASAGTGGGGGSGGGVTNTEGPCDIYNKAGNTCVAAYSTVRRLLSTYTGPLYQVRKGGPKPNQGSGGMTMDIGVLPNGFANAAAHKAFCGEEYCTFSKLYDQSGKENHLTVAKRGCYGCSNPQQQCSSCTDTACENDNETEANKTITVGGNTVYTVHMKVKEGYRNNGTAWPTDAPPAKDMPRGNPANGQGIYMVAEGKGRRPDAATACCWNFGNVSNNNCYGPSGQMNALMLGNGYWGKGEGNGPWFMGDFEAGVWAGGVNGDINSGGFDKNTMLPSMTMDFAFGVLKTKPNNYAIRYADATTGMLNTAYDGAAPNVFQGDGVWQMSGGIALGIGGDNSNHASGTFLEGAITNSRPSNETDEAVHANVKAMGYGK